MNDTAPQVVVLGGPNGAGKSTLAPEVVATHLGIGPFVNADVIARGLSGFSPQAVDIAAGRLMLARLKQLAGERADFAFETTLASRTFVPWIRGLVESGYEFHLYYCTLNSADLAVERVRKRFESGGHSVPELDVRRRFVRSAANLFQGYMPLATTWRVFNNSGQNETRLVAFGGMELPPTIIQPTDWQRLRSVADEVEKQ